MSTFITQLDSELVLKVLPPNTSAATPTPNSQSQTPTKQSLRTFFLELTPPASLYDARESLADLQQLDSVAGALTRTADEEEVTLRRAILGKLIIGLYSQALNTFLQEATNAETELEWWSDVGRSRWNVGYYLLQSTFCLSSIHCISHSPPNIRDQYRVISSMSLTDVIERISCACSRNYLSYVT